MDRRNFFKSMLAAPLLTPVLLASQRHHNDGELYLISDEPHRFLSSILKELEPTLPIRARTFVMEDAHAMGSALVDSLMRAGWTRAPHGAALSLSFQTMRQPARPSFSLVRGGRIWDVRTRRLRALWDEMSRNHTPATVLTVAGWRKPGAVSGRGEALVLIKDGRRAARIPLDRDSERSFRDHRGTVTVRVAAGRARITDSSCRHRICLYSPPISLPGERIICAPNRLLAEVIGTGGVDTVIG